MDHSSSININADEQEQLLSIARQSIKQGLTSGEALRLDLTPFSGILVEQPGVFVTLTQAGELRGCIGNLETSEPLVHSVASSAFNAAFRDRRFPALSAGELDHTEIEISILSEMQPMSVENRNELIKQLRPGIDGLLFEDGAYRSTFLPQVWDKLNGPEDFLQQLMIKGDLPSDYWSESIRFSRYQTLSFHE